MYNNEDTTDGDYYYDPEPGWGGSGEPCSRCGTTEYFDSCDDEGQPLCHQCLRKWLKTQ